MCKSISKVLGFGGSSKASTVTSSATTAPTNTLPPLAGNTDGNGATPAPATRDQTTTPAQQQQAAVASEQDGLSYGLQGLAGLFDLLRGRGYQRGASTNVGTIGAKLGQ